MIVPPRIGPGLNPLPPMSTHASARLCPQRAVDAAQRSAGDRAQIPALAGLDSADADRMFPAHRQQWLLRAGRCTRGLRSAAAGGAGDGLRVPRSFPCHRSPAWSREAKRAFEWFLGRNDLGQPFYDFSTGGCSHGLHQDRVNENQGAESTLALHLALAEMNCAEQLITLSSVPCP